MPHSVTHTHHLPAALSTGVIPIPKVRSSILGKIIRASVIMASMCIVVIALVALITLQTELSGIQASAEQTAAVILEFGKLILLISALLITFAAMVGYFLAKSIAWPLRRVAISLKDLQPGHWLYARTVHTRDEVEVLDHVIADLTARLKTTYDHLEELVAERTQQLKREYALDRAILDSIEYGVATLDAKGLVSDVNPALVKLLGFTLEECIGKRAVDLLQLSQKRSKFTEETHPVMQLIKSRRSFRSSAAMHLSLLKKDETLLPVLLMATPLLEGDTLLGGIVIFQDMTEDRQIDYMKSEFITLASHQLRTPLSAVRWNLELFGEAGVALTQDQKEYITEIDQSSTRMAKVLDELLHAARLEEGGYAYDKQEVNLTTVLQRIVDENAIVAQASGITLVPQFATDAIPASTDPILLEIILQNLIGNAVKYSEKGSQVEFTVEKKPDHVLIHVIDHGFGIPVHEQKRVFEKFFRAHNVRQKDTDGTGLGLYISKRALASLGGTITFESKEGKGSTFMVKLPLK